MDERHRWAIQAGWVENGDTNHNDTFSGTLQRMDAAAKILENMSGKVKIFSQNHNPTYFRIRLCFVLGHLLFVSLTTKVLVFY